MVEEVRIDFDQILEVALKGLRRSSVFMGLGVNAALDAAQTAYQLSHLTHIQIVPDDLPGETVQHFKEQFKLWIEAAALREATETFSLFLDELHRACSTIKTFKEDGVFAEIAESQAQYVQQGFPNKLNILRQRFGV